MKHFKLLIIFCLNLSYIFSSGLSDSGDNIIKDTAKSNVTDTIDTWKPDRFFPHHKDNPNNKKAAIKLGINFKFVEFSLEDSSVSQTGVNTETSSQQALDAGQTIDFKKKLTLSYEALFMYKSKSDYDAPLLGVNFWFYEQKPINSTFTPEAHETLSSTYSLSPNSFLSNIKSVAFNHTLKLRLLKVFVSKYLFSAKHFFFSSGFGSNIIIIDHTRNIAYSSSNETHCICYTQKIKGVDIHLITNLGINTTNALGLEIYYETGLLLNKYTINTQSFTEGSEGSIKNAHVFTMKSDINQSQRITILGAYNNFQFSKYHYAIKGGIELYVLETDKISTAIGQSSGNTKSMYLPSIILNFDVYF